MDLAAPHVAYVIVCYAVSGLALGGLWAAIAMRARSIRRQLEALETEGAPRRVRSAASPA